MATALASNPASQEEAPPGLVEGFYRLELDECCPMRGAIVRTTVACTSSAITSDDHAAHLRMDLSYRSSQVISKYM